VTNAIMAVGNARIFLEQDGLDVRVAPAFVHVTKSGERNDRTAVKMYVYSERI